MIERVDVWREEDDAGGYALALPVSSAAAIVINRPSPSRYANRSK